MANRNGNGARGGYDYTIGDQVVRRSSKLVTKDSTMTTAKTAAPATTLTTLEQTVLDALWQSALDSTGGDFACLDEVSVPKLGRKALGGVVTSLATKNAISVDESFINGDHRSKGTRVVQVTFPEAFRSARQKALAPVAELHPRRKVGGPVSATGAAMADAVATIEKRKASKAARNAKVDAALLPKAAPVADVKALGETTIAKVLAAPLTAAVKAPKAAPVPKAPLAVCSKCGRDNRRRAGSQDCRSVEACEKRRAKARELAKAAPVVAPLPARLNPFAMKAAPAKKGAKKGAQ